MSDESDEQEAARARAHRERKYWPTLWAQMPDGRMVRLVENMYAGRNTKVCGERLLAELSNLLRRYVREAEGKEGPGSNMGG